MKRESGGSRSGFALLLTLAVLSVVMALSVAALQYMDEARRRSEDITLRVEANRLFADIKTLFAKLGKEAGFHEALYASALPLASETSDFRAVMECRPLPDAVNFNWLALDRNVTYRAFADAVVTVLRNAAGYYEVEDPEGFVMTISGRAQPLDSRVLQRVLPEKYGKITWQQFRTLVEAYALWSGDASVEKVPWKELFVFEPLVSSGPRKIAANYIREDAAAFLFGLDPSLVREIWRPGKGDITDVLLQAGITKLDGTLFHTDVPKASRCRVVLTYKNKTLVFSFTEEEGKVNRFVVE